MQEVYSTRTLPRAESVITAMESKLFPQQPTEETQPTSVSNPANLRAEEGAVTQAQETEEALALLAVRMGEEKRQRTRRMRVFLFSFAPLLLTLVFGFLQATVGLGKFWFDFWARHEAWLMLFVGIGLGSGAMLLGRMLFPKRMEPHRRALESLEDVRAVGPLADALLSENAHIRRIAEEALLPLLPRLKASDARLLNEAQRQALLNALRYPHDPRPLALQAPVFSARRRDHAAALQVAILKAFEQIGDSRALPVVRRLAEGRPKSAWERAVQEAAAECLPFLEARAEQQNAEQTLLRAAAAASAAPETLLRPASSSPAADPGLLLRPGESP